MAHLDYDEANKEYRARVLEGIRSHFPVEGKMQRLELESLEVDESGRHADDVTGQHETKVKGGTWAVPVHGVLALKDAEGRVIQRKRMQMAELPSLTRRHSYLIDGQEWQADNQWQLKPGVYTRRKDNNVLESRFNTPNTREFSVTLNTKTKEFMMKRGKSEAIPVYPLMKALGVDDDTLERSWGPEILQANKQARGASGALAKFYRSDRKTAPESTEVAADYFRNVMDTAELRPDVTEKTLGKGFSNITGDTFVRATRRILDVHGGADEDDRDALEYKDLRTAGDYTYDRLVEPRTRRAIRGRMMRKVNFATDVRDVVKFDMFNDPVRRSFSDNSAVRVADQINPAEMLASAWQTTVMGPGGIENQQAINNMVGVKLVNPSHLGFLDPTKTPESEKTGVSLRMPIGVTKVGREPRMHLYNMKTRRTELVSPTEFKKATVALPDQLDWEGDKPKFAGSRVKASLPGNEIGDVKPSEVQYAIRNPSQLFGVTTNLIPFMSTNSGNRVTYAGQHIEQAISLRDREPPLVQVGAGGSTTWEGLLGAHTSHTAPVSGTVVGVTKDRVTIQDAKGAKRDVHLYNNYPLNDKKSMLDSTARVAVGDKVRAGQHVADTNFTRDGNLALGTNLRAAYIPYKGYNFEDGVVISRSAAQKLSSEHLHKPSMKMTEDLVTSSQKYKVQHPEVFTNKQYALLGDDGVVQVGKKVQPGDPLILATRPYQLKGRMGENPLRKALAGSHTDASMRWESDYPGEVVGVYRKKNGEVAVHVRTTEPMQVGDKIAGRYGNKGIVTLVVDDDKMPHTKDGKHIEVALNPSGVPGRMNAGQILETAASKIAEKTGKPYVVQNFSRGSALSQVRADLAKHGLTDQEELLDPTTGVAIGKALVGKQHMLKLTHQVDKKVAVRSGMSLPGSEEPPEGYDANLIPSGGGKAGGQSIGHLGLYSLLAHGAHANIREMQTWKSEGPDPQAAEHNRWPSQHNRVWAAIQEGTHIPTPKPTFAYQKFTDMLRGAGINVDKNGHKVQLTPLTDKQVLAMSNGELPKPQNVVYAKVDPKTGDLKPEKGGIFDPKITGGTGGMKWSHIRLPEPVPNPVFSGAIQKLTGLKASEYAAVASGDKALTAACKVVPLGTSGALAGGAGLARVLDGIDVKKDLAAAEKALSAIDVGDGLRKSPSRADALVKKIKYLRMLDQTGIKPSEAYVVHNVPVLPPAMRAPSILNDGSVKWADLNALYKSLGEQVSQLTPTLMDAMSEEMKAPFRKSMYDAVAAIQGIGSPKGEQKDRGILQQIAGTGSPKRGFFQKALLNRKQDMTMRSTIVPEPALGLDEVGLPTDKAMSLYLPFVVRKLQDLGAAPNALEAQKVLKEKGPMARRALEAVVAERPLLLKRDPALHKQSVQAFRPRLTGGKAIKIHPLVTSAYNADFDGDTMSAYVPISEEAVKEARNMFPSNNLYNEATGKVLFQPTLESALGLYKLSRVDGADSKMTFDKPADALRAVQQGKLAVTAPAMIGGVKTTPGRVLMASALPENMRGSVLTDMSLRIDRKGLDRIFTDLAKSHRGDFGVVANRLKDIGTGASSGAVAVVNTAHKGPEALAVAERASEKRQYVPVPVHTLSLDDLEPDVATRNKFLRTAQKQVDQIERSSLPRAEKERRVVDTWNKASSDMTRAHMQKMEKNPTNLAIMSMAGVKPSVDQYRQMVLAPMVLGDAAGRPVKTPVRDSYSEGLDVAGYWTQMHGARAGTIKKVQEVREPGVLSKMLMQTSMNVVVTDDDCGTHRGVSMPVGSRDLHDRVLASDFKSRNVHVPRGTVLTPAVVDTMRAADKGANVLVRSTLKCEHDKGVCQKCAGLSPEGRFYDKGANVGVLAAQSLGERSVQLTMKAFHSGGVQATGGAQLLDSFKRVEDLTMLTKPKDTADTATLAMRSGKVEKVERDATGVKVWVGGVPHHVGKDRSGLGLHENLPFAPKQPEYRPWAPPKVGARVTAGQPLSDPNRTAVNPHDLYRATGNMEQVQNFLTDELHRIFGKEGVRRQHVETVVHAMGKLTKVRDPGSSNLLRGDFVSASKVRALNKRLEHPIEHSPVLKGVDVLPLAVQEDWMAKLMHRRLRDSIIEAASTGAVSDIHGLHPIPGMAMGSEFGLTSRHSAAPSLGHLKDVPSFSY